MGTGSETMVCKIPNTRMTIRGKRAIGMFHAEYVGDSATGRRIYIGRRKVTLAMTHPDVGALAKPDYFADGDPKAASSSVAVLERTSGGKYLVVSAEANSSGTRYYYTVWYEL